MATSVVKSVIGSKASKKAASQQAAAAADATAQQRDQYEQTREDLFKNYETDKANYQPFLTTGTAANNQLGYLMGLGGTGTGEAGSLAKSFTMADFEADPGYKFRLEEGIKALDRVNSAKGKYYSGGAAKALTDYNQASASQEYQSAYDRYRNNQADLYSRLTGVSNTGLSAAGGIANSGANTQSQLNNAGQNMINQVNENIVGAGNARAGGTIGAGQAWITGLNDLDNKRFAAAGMATGLAPGIGSSYRAVPNGNMLWNGGREY